MEILSSASSSEKFGLKGGVILLGCVWAVWHLPIDFFYYTTPDMGLAALASQFVTCISLGIFMAYTYMKTQNIWVPIIIHFLNNNMVVVFQERTLRMYFRISKSTGEIFLWHW